MGFKYYNLLREIEFIMRYIIQSNLRNVLVTITEAGLDVVEIVSIFM